MITIRRLTIADTDLIAQALAWADEMPRFFRDADAAWGTTSVDDYLADMQRDPQADFGVFEDDAMCAVMTIALVAPDVYNWHLMMKRGTALETLIVALLSIKQQMIKQGMKVAWAWPLRQNRGLQRVLEIIGMSRDGLTMLKGKSHGVCLEWWRYTLTV